jgi:arylsulfatase A-like enzyme
MGRPNIVVIMTDQQRWDTLGAYGNDRIRTPHLDRLAGEGALFEHAFVPIPLCTPSRASLFTGQYPARHGLFVNMGRGSSTSTANLAGALHDAGYRTMLVGKDHLFEEEGRARWFDHVVAYDHAGRVSDGDADERAVRASRQGRFDERYIEREICDAEHAPTRRITGAAIDAVRDAPAHGQPFFLWLSYPDPHPPYVVAEPYASMYRGQDLGQPATRPGELDDKPLRQRMSQRLMRAADYTLEEMRRLREIYYGMVSFIDDEVGRFARMLDEEGIAGDTIVVFMSDHGDYLGDHGMVRKSPAMYDSLVRIPLLISWPGRISPMRVTDTLVESTDLAPTLLELADVGSLPGADGRSLVPLLRGETLAHKTHVFGLYGSAGAAYTAAEVEAEDLDALMTRPHPWMHQVTMRGRMAMVRTMDWKLVHYRNGEGELYDLREDPDELVNRYEEPTCAGVRAELTQAVADFLLDAIR